MHPDGPTALCQVERNRAAEPERSAGHKRGRVVLRFGHDGCDVRLEGSGDSPPTILPGLRLAN
jgi:hypothetical protein